MGLFDRLRGLIGKKGEKKPEEPIQSEEPEEPEVPEKERSEFYLKCLNAARELGLYKDPETKLEKAAATIFDHGIAQNIVDLEDFLNHSTSSETMNSAKKSFLEQDLNDELYKVLVYTIHTLKFIYDKDYDGAVDNYEQTHGGELIGPLRALTELNQDENIEKKIDILIRSRHVAKPGEFESFLEMLPTMGLTDERYEFLKQTLLEMQNNGRTLENAFQKLFKKELFEKFKSILPDEFHDDYQKFIEENDYLHIFYDILLDEEVQEFIKKRSFASLEILKDIFKHKYFRAEQKNGNFKYLPCHFGTNRLMALMTEEEANKTKNKEYFLWVERFFSKKKRPLESVFTELGRNMFAPGAREFCYNYLPGFHDSEYSYMHMLESEFRDIEKGRKEITDILKKCWKAIYNLADKIQNSKNEYIRSEVEDDDALLHLMARPSRRKKGSFVCSVLGSFDDFFGCSRISQEDIEEIQDFIEDAKRYAELVENGRFDSRHEIEMVLDVYSHLVDEFYIRHKIGKGAHKIVLEGIEKETGKPVAIKIERIDNTDARAKEFIRRKRLNDPSLEKVSDKDILLKFYREESNKMRELEGKSTNLPIMHRTRLYDDLYFVSVEKLYSTNLRSYIEQKGTLSIDETIEKSIEILDGLDKIHQCGYFHGDLWSANIIIDEDGRCIVSDFGPSSHLPTPKDKNKRYLSTCAVLYRAPELFDDKRPTKPTDLFSVGIMIYEMLTGQFPFLEMTLEEWNKLEFKAKKEEWKRIEERVWVDDYRNPLYDGMEEKIKSMTGEQDDEKVRRVSDAIKGLLEKKPEDRKFQDASALKQYLSKI